MELVTYLLLSTTSLVLLTTLLLVVVRVHKAVVLLTVYGSLVLSDRTRDTSVTSLTQICHIAVPFEFIVVAFCFPRNTIPKQTSRKTHICIFNGENFVKAPQIFKLVLSAVF